MRERVRGLLEQSHLLPYVKRARGVVSPAARRAQRDDQNLHLMLAFSLRSDSNCIDIGANRGSVLADFVRYAPSGKHIAYEPLPHLAAQLSARFPDVDVRCAALSNTAGEASFVHLIDHPDYSGFKSRADGGRAKTETLTVRLDKLDDALPDGYRPDVIKIDVEGAEKQVLEGAIQTLRQAQPLLVFEHGRGGADRYDTTPADVFGLVVDEARLRIFDMDGNGPYSRQQFDDVFSSGKYWNFVARP